MDPPYNGTNTTRTSFSPSNTGASQLFPRANVFGIFLTLQLCQLTQPYGSLIFRGAAGFLWRCNPIASFTEACIIVWQLLWHTYTEAGRRRRSGLELISWKRQLYDTASGLLLLRGAMGDDLVMEGLMAKSLLDGEEDLAPPASVRSSPLTRAGNSRSENIAESPTGPCNTSSEVRSQDVPEAEPSPLSLSAEISEGAPLGDAPSVPQQGPSQHRTTGLDLGLMSSPPISTLPFADVGSRQSRLVHAAFGSNTLAHREWRIDLVTAISVLLILVKLPAIHGAFWFTTVGYLVISGWMSVQLLLLLFHIKDVGDLDVANSVRTAQLLDDKLQKEAIFWKAVYAAFHLPILSYLSYLLTFHLTFPHWLSWLGNIFQGILVIMATIIFYLSLLAVMICIFAGLRFLVLTIIRCAYPDNSQDEGPCYNLRNGLLLLLLALPVLIWLGTANLTYARKTRPTHRFNNNGTYHPIFTNPTLDMLVDSGYRKIVAGIWLLLILVWLTLIFCFTFFFQFEEGSAGKRSLRKRVSVGNALIAVAVFIWYIVTYDPIGTRKPDWLEWLG